MQGGQQQFRKPSSIIWTWIGRGLVLMALVVVGILGHAAWFANKAEENLIALSETTILVCEFVTHNDGRWPHSWEELSTAQQFTDRSSDVSRLAKYVEINFEADPDVLREQTPEAFRAIRQKDEVHMFRSVVERRCNDVIDALRKTRTEQLSVEKGEQ